MRKYILIGVVAAACEDTAKDTDTVDIIEVFDADGDGFDEREDCDDTDASIYPRFGVLGSKL